MATIDLLSDGIGPSYVAVRTSRPQARGVRGGQGWFGEITFETPTALLLETNGARKAATVRCTDADCERASGLSPTVQPRLPADAPAQPALRAAATAARIIGTCSGIRPQATTLTAVLRDRLLSSAICRLPGHTPSSSAALAQPATRRVRGTARPTAHASSATPLAKITSRWAGTHAGISGSKTSGRTRWTVPLPAKPAASTLALSGRGTPAR